MKAYNIKYEELNKLSDYLSKLYGIRKHVFSKESKDHNIEEVIKNWMKVIFTTNLIIVQSKSANAIRHFFPKNNIIEPEFFNLLKSAFKVINIDISKRKENPAKPNERTYFYFKNYKSVLTFLLYCEGESPILNKINKIKDIFIKSEVYIYFTQDFMGQIFEEKGIIHQNNLTITKFFTDMLKISSYKRHSFYRWREEKYLPVQVVLKLNNLEIFNKNYDTNFFKYISSIKFGKTKSEEKFEKDFLVEIKKKHKEKILNLFPQTESNLGNFLNLIFSPPKLKYERKNLLPKFEEFISNYDLPDSNKVENIIKEIRRRLLSPETEVRLKSLKMKNFKSYDEEVIDFEDGTNIFYGQNGSGKTTIIEAIFFSLFHLEIEFYMNLRQTYDYENLPIIEPVADTIPIMFIYPKVNVIQQGKKFCRVILELLQGDSSITIKREVWRNGQQELSFNGHDVLKEIREKLEFIKLIKNSKEQEIFFKGESKSLLINREKSEISFLENSEINYEFLYDAFSSHVILEKIHNSYKEYGIYFDIEEIYASFNNNYRFIDSISLEDSITLDYYNRFFGLHYIIDTLDHYIEGIGKLEILNKQETAILYEKLSSHNVFQKINQIDEEIFKTVKIGDKCLSCGKIIKKFDLNSSYRCQKCGSIYCFNCVIIERELTHCKICNEELDWGKFNEIILDEEDFYSLLELKGFYRDFGFSSVEGSSELIVSLGFPYLIDAYLNEWTDFLLEDIDSIKLKNTIRKVIHQFENLIIEIKEDTLKKLLYYSGNPSINILFNLAKRIINENDESKSLENEIGYFLTDLRSGIEFSSNKIINFLILNSVKNCSQLNSKTFLMFNPREIKEIKLQWSKLKIEIVNNIEMKRNESRGLSEGWKPFETRQVKLLIKLFNIMEAHLVDPRIENLLNILKDEFYPTEQEKQKIDYVKRGPISESIDELHLDYKIMVNQLLNQLHLIEEIIFNKEGLKIFISNLKSDQEFIIFLKDIYCYLFKLNFEITQEMYKRESKSIFGHTDISSYIDDAGNLKIKYRNSEEIYPFENLSGGERSKFLLILVSILIKLSNKNTFYLIDEPNELIDPLNIDALKKTLYNLFSGKQIVICTFIDNYKKFKPALIYQVNKGPDGISRLERISPKTSLPDFRFSLKYFNNMKKGIQKFIKFDEFEEFGKFTTMRTDKIEIKFTGFDASPMISINSDDKIIKEYISSQILSQLSNKLFKGNSMISGITGSGKTSLIKRYLTHKIEELKIGSLIIDTFGEYKDVADVIGKDKNLYHKIEKVPIDSKINEFIKLVLNSNTLLLDISPLKPEFQNKFLIKLLITLLSKCRRLLENSSNDGDTLISEYPKTMIFIEEMRFSEENMEVIENLMRESRKFNLNLTLVSQMVIKKLVPFMHSFISYKTTNNEDINILINIHTDISSENFKQLKTGQLIINSMFLKTPIIVTLTK